MRDSACVCLFVVALLATLTTGCGGAPATVSGKVTVDGQAYPGLRVSFIPEAGGATATSTTAADGGFSVKTGRGVGLQPGDYRITVKGFSKTPSPTMTKQQVDALRIVPEEHSSRERTPHRHAVTKGHNTVNIEI